MMRKAIYLLLSITLASCQSTDHEGYDRVDDSIHYKLLAIGDDELSVEKADHLSFKCVVKMDKNIVAEKRFHRIKPSIGRFPEYFEEVLSSSNQGDSISIIGLANELDINSIIDANVIDSNANMLEVELVILEAYSDEQLRALLAKNRMMKDYELNEMSHLARLRDSLEIIDTNKFGGIEVKILEKGNSKKPLKGNRIRVHYVTRLGTGRVIDNTYNREPFDYEVGRPDQVLNGFAVGVSKMTEGGKALFIIPPTLAFGAKGSAGIVPPNASIIYEVELLEVGI